MKIDFSQPITTYELIAIILAVLSLAIPAFKWLYNKYIKKAKIDFLPVGKINLYFNRSGSYIYMGGTFDLKNKPANIKKISANIIRQSDNATLELEWSTFKSPVFRQVAGNYESTFETAHPFIIPANSMYPCLVEFSNSKVNVNKEIDRVTTPYHIDLYKMLETNIPFEASYNTAKNHPQYADTKLSVSEYLFWKPGKYTIILNTRYNDTDFNKKYKFTLTEKDCDSLKHNVDNILMAPIDNHFKMPAFMEIISKDYIDC